MSSLSDLAVLVETTQFAAVAHRNQRRKDEAATPYINHPVGVAHLISSVGKVDDLLTLQGALLHDTVEDTNTTLEELKEKFGPEVAQVVSEVSDDKALSKHARKLAQIEHAATVSNSAKLIKLADKLYNLQSLITSLPTSWSPERAQAYFGWAREVIDKIRGTNIFLERKLDSVFQSSFSHNGKTYPCISDNYCDGDWKKATPTSD
eukprot:m.16363 g.16363  ORF g.16363 m.16363 type:complete len:206 (-) comp4606_c1_seq1:19-636(-)